MTSSLRKLNKSIAKNVSDNITLVKGEGYHYFVFDDGVGFEMKTIYTPYTNDFSDSRWMEEAKDFLNTLSLAVYMAHKNQRVDHGQ